MEVKTADKRVYISLPKKYMAALAEKYELDHGLFLSELNPSVNEENLHGYFKDWGTITLCQIRKSPNSEENKAVAYVRFSTEEEADQAERAGPYFIEGDVEVKRVVSPKGDSR